MKFQLTITATTSNGQTWEGKEPKDALTALYIKVGDATKNTEGNKDSGIVSMNVENSKVQPFQPPVAWVPQSSTLLVLSLFLAQLSF